MHGQKENQEISVVGRLVSLEALVVLMGIASLVYGLATLNVANIIIGAVILLAALLAARKWRRGRHAPIERRKP